MGVVAANPNTRILLDSYDLSGFANAADMQFTQQTLDARTFNSVGPRNVPGNYDHTHNLTALWDGASNVGAVKQSDEIMYGLWSSDADHYYGEFWGNNTVGSKAYESVVKLQGEPIRGQNGQLITFNAKFVGNGPMSRGYVLANATATSSGSYTGSHDLSADLSTAQLYQAVGRALTGSSFSMTVEIMDSSDGVTYASMAGMSMTLTQTNRVFRKSSSNGTKQYHRARISAMSGCSTAVALIVTGGQVTT